MLPTVHIRRQSMAQRNKPDTCTPNKEAGHTTIQPIHHHQGAIPCSLPDQHTAPMASKVPTQCISHPAPHPILRNWGAWSKLWRTITEHDRRRRRIQSRRGIGIQTVWMREEAAISAKVERILTCPWFMGTPWPGKCAWANFTIPQR